MNVDTGSRLDNFVLRKTNLGNDKEKIIREVKVYLNVVAVHLSSFPFSQNEKFKSPKSVK